MTSWKSLRWLPVVLGVSACSAAAALGPKVMILVDEKSLGTVATSEIEALAIRKLADQQIDTVDQDMVRANLKRMQQALKGAGDNRGAAALGREFGADIILVGEAVCKPSARRIAESNLRAYQAVVTLRAVRTDNSVNLASASEDVSVVGLDDVSGSAKALRAAGEKALDSLVPAMLRKWQEGGGSASAVEITVGGVDQIWKLQAIRESLRNRPSDIPNVMQKSYAQGIAVFRVESRLPAEELAESLVLKPPEGLKIQVVEITPAALNLRAVEAQ
jgi:hypothetical protein